MDAGESNANTEPQTGDGRRGSVPSVASATPAGTAATTEPAAQGLPSAAAAESPGQPSQAEAAQPADGAPRTVPVVTLLLTPSPPHPNTPPPFAFEPLERDLFENVVLKIGRQVNRGVNPRDSLAAGRDCVWFKSKVVSRNHAEIWVKDGTVYLKDTGSSSGTFLNHLRLSPSGRESRPYPLKEGDIIQLGIDYQGRPEEIYKFRTALRALLTATNPYASAPTPAAVSAPALPPPSNPQPPIDCCICLCSISPFQALFVAPCSHCYHYKCVQPILLQGAMFLCPLCRQVANLAANVQEEEEEGEEVETGVFSLDADNMRDEVTVAVRPGEASSDSERERVDSGTGNATPIPTDAEPISTIGGQGEVEELDAMVEMVVASPRRDRDGGPAPMQQDGESDVAGPVAGTSNVVGPSTAGHAHLSSPETDGEEMEVDVKRVRDDERDEGAGGGPMEV